jgi:hypothetical protein
VQDQQGDAGTVSVFGAPGDYAGNAGTQRSPIVNGQPRYWRPHANGVLITAEMFDPPRPPSSNWESEMTFDRITDGLSRTIMAGEKHVPLGELERQGSLYNGDNQYNCARVAGAEAPLAKSPLDRTLCKDVSGRCKLCVCDNFGSWHRGIIQFVYCDGHVDGLSVSTDDAVMARLAQRSDGG